jgi:hypothetical protein
MANLESKVLTDPMAKQLQALATRQ